jgi:hypothetical protein
MPVVSLSIVIPVAGTIDKLEDTLVSVLENRPAHCEVVVVLNERYDDPYELAGEVRFVEAPAHADVLECLNGGIAASRGTIVHTLTCGMEVTPGWTDAAMPHFERPDVGAVAAKIVDRNDRRQTLSTGVAYKAGGKAWRSVSFDSTDFSRTPPRAYHGPDFLAGFFRRSALEAVGGLARGFPTDLASVDLAMALQTANQQCVIESSCCVLADGADFPAGQRLTGGAHAERLFWRWARRTGWLRAGTGHVALLANECLEGIVRPVTLLGLLGRAWAMVRLPLRGRNEFSLPDMTTQEASVITHPHFRTWASPTWPEEISKAS